MQVATLFRETANLLGASMVESASSNPSGGNNGGNSSNSGSCSPQSQQQSITSRADPIYTRPIQDRYKSITNENQDDGYETSADMVLNNQINNVSNMDQLDSDPYSFVDDEHSEKNHNSLMQMPLQHQQLHSNYLSPTNMLIDSNGLMPSPRKRGRKKKLKLDEDGNVTKITKVKSEGKERKKHDRFNGMPEEEVSKRTLPDHLTENLDIIIIGINPGLFAAYKGHHYAGPGNHFWKCLYLSGLTAEQMTADEDYKLLQVGIGFTNMVQRATKGSADLTRKEIKEGSQILLEKLQHFKPKIAVFNGKLIYEVFSGKKDFCFGRQPDLVDGTNTYMWVMPSSSARCAQLPRAADKVPFYAALKKFRDYLNGMVSMIDESEVVFSEARIKSSFESDVRNQNSNDFIDISSSGGGKQITGDDSIIVCKKKRGRPKKVKIDGEETPVQQKPPPVKRIYNPTPNLNPDGTKKKRGRPKKVRPENGVDSLSTSNNNSGNDQTSKSVTPLPDQSSNDYCHVQSQQNPTSQIYNNQQTTSSSTPANSQHLPSYIQSPRPQSQPFTHSDLSSEISAAISSEHLESPAPTSPSLDAPDFDPPTNMPTEDTTECCFSSPTPSTTSEQQQTPPMIRPLPYSAYNNNNNNTNTNNNNNYNNSSSTVGSSVSTTITSNTHNINIVKPEYKVQDMSSKSLSGLESLVDQIPNIADSTSESANSLHHSQLYHHDPISTAAPPPATTPFQLSNYSTSPASSLAPNPSSFGFTSNYPANNYTNHLMGGMHSAFIEHHNCAMPAVPVPLTYHQLPVPPVPPYTQQYSGGYPGAPGAAMLHVPSPNYPNGYGGYSAGAGYAATVSTSPTATYHHHMFDRLKPDTSGYGSF